MERRTTAGKSITALASKRMSKLDRANFVISSNRLYRPQSRLPPPNHNASVDSDLPPMMSAQTTSGTVPTTSGESLSFASSSATEEIIEDLTRFNVSELLYDDVDEVRALLNEQTLRVFNVEDPFHVIHRCYISYKLINAAHQIVGVICMDEYPNVPALPPAGWTHWAERLYNIKDLTSYNSLWVHLVAYDPPYERSFLRPLLNNLFHEVMSKQFVLFVVPRGCQEMVGYLDGCSSLVLPQDYTDPTRVQTIRLCVRQDFITQYKIRRAVEEDNDDLVPLIHKFSPRFVELYGPYYVAEIISRHPEAGRNIIVAEHQGEAVSVLCLNPTVNYAQLNDCFDLNVFTGLYKAETAKQVPKVPGTNVEPKVESEPELELDLDILRKEARATMRSYYARATMRSMDWIMPWMTASASTTESSTSTPKGRTFSILDDLGDFTQDHSSTSMVLAMSVHRVSGMVASEESTSESSESVRSDLTFVGVENAFAIEILAAHTMHQPSLALLIISCFECFPTRDYCLLTLPHEADYSSIMNYFVRVQPKLNSQHPHELYICHRGQLSPMRIITAGPEDADKVADFVGCIQPPNTPGEIVANYRLGVSGEAPYLTFLAMSGKHHRYPVGLAQVSTVTDLGTIKRKYAVNRRSDIRRDNDFSFGYLLSFVMSPLFKRHLRYFLREIHRKTDFGTLFYALNQHDAMEYRVRPLSFAMKDMWMVPPRKIRISMKKPDADYPGEPYALFMSTPKLMSKPAVQINQRIVVVGASCTALSFLEKLLANEVTQCLVTFNNVLLVSTDGLVRHKKVDSIKAMFGVWNTLMDSEYIEKIGLRSRICVLKGTLTAIDRKNKTITVGKKIIVPYDYLFLMTGLQYGPPRRKGAKEFAKVKLPPTCFTINTDSDCDRALSTLARLLGHRHSKEPYQIIVYGHSIYCYCCIAGLLEFGVPGEYISLIEPWPRDKDPPVSHDFVFQDGAVYETVVELVKSLKVDIRTGFKLIDWYSTPLTLKFESLTRFLVLKPLCAFLYSDAAVNISLFNAIHGAGLVYDGRLVIDPECHTNDEHIFAAGPVTKYSRKLWADHLSHRHFNSYEIGGRLGRRIRSFLLPFKERQRVSYEFGKSCWPEGKHTVPYYFKPLVTYCKLPGGLRYLNVVKPGPQVPLETAMSDSDYGAVFTTGNCRNLKSQGYFRIHLNNHRMVETITCLSMQKFDYAKLVLLWGKHEALLNNLVRRFESMYITDFFEYFKKPWCSAIFMDDFPLLENSVMKIMTSLTKTPGESPLEDLYRMYKENGYRSLTAEQRRLVNEKFADSAYDGKIQALVMEFIRDNLGVLDMYAHPVIVNYILSGYDQSPMFKKV